MHESGGRKFVEWRKGTGEAEMSGGKEGDRESYVSIHIVCYLKSNLLSWKGMQGSRRGRKEKRRRSMRRVREVNEGGGGEEEEDQIKTNPQKKRMSLTN